jgi:hypothetical protein
MWVLQALSPVPSDPAALALVKWAWLEVPKPLSAAWPSPRKSHAMAVAPMGGVMYLHGGTQRYGGHLSDLFSLDTSTLQAWALARCSEAGISALTTTSASGAASGAAHASAAGAAAGGGRVRGAGSGPGAKHGPGAAAPPPPPPRAAGGAAGATGAATSPSSDSILQSKALWTELPADPAGAAPGVVPPPALFSHTLTAWRKLLLVVGGHPTDHHDQVHTFDLVRLLQGHASLTGSRPILVCCVGRHDV